MITLIAIIVLEAIIIVGLILFTNVVINQRKSLEAEYIKSNKTSNYNDKKAKVYKQALDAMIQELNVHNNKTNISIVRNTMNSINNELNFLKLIK